MIIIHEKHSTKENGEELLKDYDNGEEFLLHFLIFL